MLEDNLGLLIGYVSTAKDVNDIYKLLILIFIMFLSSKINILSRISSSDMMHKLFGNPVSRISVKLIKYIDKENRHFISFEYASVAYYIAREYNNSSTQITATRTIWNSEYSESTSEDIDIKSEIKLDKTDKYSDIYISTNYIFADDEEKYTILLMTDEKFGKSYIYDFIQFCGTYYNKTRSIDRITECHYITIGNVDKNIYFKSPLNYSIYGNGKAFDHLYGNNFKILEHSLNLLKDENFYKERGLKRKLGYLFYGPPGTGKTSAIKAMSEFTGRHILNISLSKIHTNSQLESLFCSQKMNEINIRNSNVIYVFEEIDFVFGNNKEIISKTSAVVIKKKDEEDSSSDDDQLSMSTLLTLTDGIGTADNSIIIATTNHPEKINDALMRDGRLTKMFFGKLDNKEIRLMMKDFYKEKYTLSEDDENILNNLHNLAPSTVMVKCLENYRLVDCLKILSEISANNK